MVARYRLEARTLRSVSSERFVLDDVAYDFVEARYGEGSDCEEGCVYNYVCTIVPVDGSGDDFPLDYFWHTDTARVDEFAQYCPDDRFQSHPIFCEMPGFDLPIVCDPEVVDWANRTAGSVCGHGVVGYCTFGVQP